MSSSSQTPSAVAQDRDLHFMIGQDEAGEWLAVETHGLAGGLFKSLADAVRFAIREAGRRSDAYELAPGPLRLVF